MAAEDTKKSADKPEPTSGKRVKTPVKDVPLTNSLPSKRVKK